MPTTSFKRTQLAQILKEFTELDAHAAIKWQIWIDLAAQILALIAGILAEEKEE